MLLDLRSQWEGPPAPPVVVFEHRRHGGFARPFAEPAPLFFEDELVALAHAAGLSTDVVLMLAAGVDTGLVA